MHSAETDAVEKDLCQVGSEDVDGCPQSNPENSMQQTSGMV